MGKNSFFAIIILVFMILVPLNFFAEAERTLLDDVLGKTMIYCKKLDGAAFDFICLEEINEKIDYSRDMVTDPETGISVRNSEVRFSVHPPARSVMKNKYIYDYQLVRKKGRTVESRILLEENGRKMHEENAPLKVISFYYKNVIFGPLGLLSEFRQNQHDYDILRKEMLTVEKSIVIRAVPKPSFKQNHLYGKIWLKESDFSILKIEWDQKSLVNFQAVEETAEKSLAEPKITLISEYDYEKNGIRFPSKLTIEEAYIDQNGKKFIRSETIVLYKDYKFFTVETDIDY